MKLRLFSISATALFLGGIVYILFYASTPVFLAWISEPVSNSLLSRIRHSSLAATSHFPQWFVYSLPDGLWAFAYALLITGIWNKENAGIKYFWMSTIPALVIGSEILQYNGSIRGTFSYMDIAFEISGLLLGIYAGIKISKSYPYEKSVS